MVTSAEYSINVAAFHRRRLQMSEKDKKQQQKQQQTNVSAVFPQSLRLKLNKSISGIKIRGGLEGLSHMQ